MANTNASDKELTDELERLRDDVSRMANDVEAFKLGGDIARGELLTMLRQQQAHERKLGNHRACYVLEEMERALEEGKKTHPWLPHQELQASLEWLQGRYLSLCEAIEPFSKYADLMDTISTDGDDIPIRLDNTLAHQGERPTLGDFRRLRDAYSMAEEAMLEEEEEEDVTAPF